MPRKSPGLLEAVEFRYGNLRLRVPKSEPYTYYATYLAGEWNHLRVRPGDVVLDAGANIGDFTVRAAQQTGPSGCVIAVEPSPPALEFLRENIAVNGLKNVVISEVFLSDQDSVSFATQSGTYLVENSDSAIGAVPVRSMSLSQVLRSLEVESVDVLKMDIEGSEEKALKDRDFLRRIREIAVETHNVSASTFVRKTLSSAGFRLKTFDRHELLRQAMSSSYRHPLSIVRAEVTSRAFALRRAYSLLSAEPDLPALRPSSGIQILYGSR